MEVYKCACCGLGAFNRYASFEICPVCGWHDDVLQNEDPEMRGGANKLSLNEYKSNWPEFTREKRRRLKKRREEGRRQLTIKAEDSNKNFIPKFHIADKPIFYCVQPLSYTDIEDELLTSLGNLSVISEEESNSVRALISRHELSLGLEYLLWIIYWDDIILSRNIYDSLKFLAELMHLDLFYMQGIQYEDKD